MDALSIITTLLGFVPLKGSNCGSKQCSIKVQNFSLPIVWSVMYVSSNPSMHMIPTAEHHFSLISNLSSIALFSVKPWPYQHYVVHLSHPVSSMNTSILGSQMDNSSKNCSLSSSLLCLALNVSFFQVNPALCKKCGVHVAIHRSVPVVCSKYCWTSLRWIDGLSNMSGTANSSWAVSF